MVHLIPDLPKKKKKIIRKHVELLAGQTKTILLRASHIVLRSHSSVSFYKTSWLQFYLTFAYPGKKKRTNRCFILLAYKESVKPHFLYAKSKVFRSRARGSDKATSNYRPSPVSLCLNVYVALEKDKSPFPL